MAVLLQKVMFDLPHEVDAEAIGERDLLERVLDEPVLALRLPGPAHLMLIEDPELHGADVSTRRSGRCPAAQVAAPLRLDRAKNAAP